MSPLSQKVNCLAGTQSTRILYFRDLGDTTAAIIDRKWNEASDSRDVVARLLRSGGGMHIGFGRLFVLGDMTTGHPNLDKLAEGQELRSLSFLFRRETVWYRWFMRSFGSNMLSLRLKDRSWLMSRFRMLPLR